MRLASKLETASYRSYPCRYCGGWTSEASQLCAGICQTEYYGTRPDEFEDDEPQEREGEEL